MDIREQCRKNDVPFYFKQTGANFVKEGKRYNIPRSEQIKQAQKANINIDIRNS